MANTTYNFEIYEGVTFIRTFAYKDPTGVAITLVGKVIVFKLKLPASTFTITSGTPTALGSTLTITNAAGGLFTLKLTDEDTAAFPVTANAWWWNELQSGGDVSFLGRGPAIVKKINVK